MCVCVCNIYIVEHERMCFKQNIVYRTENADEGCAMALADPSCSGFARQFHSSFFCKKYTNYRLTLVDKKKPINNINHMIYLWPGPRIPIYVL